MNNTYHIVITCSEVDESYALPNSFMAKTVETKTRRDAVEKVAKEWCLRIPDDGREDAMKNILDGHDTEWNVYSGDADDEWTPYLFGDTDDGSILTIMAVRVS